MRVNDFYVSLRHTAKVEIDPKAHELPPDWGPFKEYKVADYFCPNAWSNNGYFVAVEEGMPLWIDLRYNPQCACILSVQRFNPISNEPANLEDGLTKEPKQNYMILPDQKWIDGYTRDGKVYQFVVTKAGEGLAVNEFVLPKEMQDSHAIGLAFFLPKNPPRSYWPESGCALSRHPKTNLQGELVVGAWGAQQRYTQQRISDDVIDGRIDQTVYQMGNPMWFSPTHTPQHWQIANQKQMATRGVVETSSTSPTYNCSAPVDSCSVDTLSNGDAAAAESLENALVESSLCDVDSVDMLDQIQHQEFDKASMGAGGRIEQEIITDPNTPEYYQKEPALVLPIYLALPEQFEHIMSRGRRQDASKADKYIHSGEVGGVQVPLVVK